MTRSNKKAGPSTRSKQPVWRRARKPVQRSTAPSTSLRKARSTPPPPHLATPSEPLLDDTPTPLPGVAHRATPFEPPPDERPTPVMPEARTNSLLTERPVALPSESELEPTDPTSEITADAPSPASRQNEKSSNGWMLAAAALMLVGVFWVAFGNSGSMSGNSDASAGKVDTKLPESPLPVAAPKAQAAAPAVGEPPNPADEATGEIIDLDAPATPAAPKAASPRVFSATPAPKAPKAPKAVEAPPPQAAAAFDPSAAESALTSAAQQATSCRQDGDPTGVARVVVTFAPSGRVTSATISGPPFAGTPTGSCIARTMRAMSLPPFTGDHMTISKTVVIM